MNLQDIIKENENHTAELKKVVDRIDMRHRQIERLNNKKNRAQDKAHWSKVVNKIMELVSNRTSDIIWNIDKVPFITGMRCQYYIFGKTIEDDITVGICFTPGNGSNVNYDTGEQTGNFPSNYIGAMNGFQNVSKQVESIDELVEMTYNKVREERKRIEEITKKFQGHVGSGVVIEERAYGVLKNISEKGLCEIAVEGLIKEVGVTKIRKATEREENNVAEGTNWNW